MKKTERKFIDFITEHYEIIMISILIILSLFLRYKMLSYEAKDYTEFLSKWFEGLANNGGFFGIKNYTGDYNAPYVIILSLLTYIPIGSLFSIKILSIIFDYLLAILASKLVYNVCEEKNKKTYSTITLLIMVFLPTIAINSSMWAQCDVIYTFFILLSLYYLQKDNTTASFISLGVAFAFKLQTIFILPLYVIIYLKKKNFSITKFLWIPLMNIILSLPSIILNKSIIGAFSVYFNQLSTYKTLTLNLPNFYNLANFNSKLFNKELSTLGICLCFLTLALILYATLKSKKDLNYKSIFTLGIVSVLTCVFLLPRMHERYLFVVDVLCIIYALMYKKGFLRGLAIQIYSLNVYFIYFTDTTVIPRYMLSILLLVILISYIRDYLKEIDVIKEKRLM